MIVSMDRHTRDETITVLTSACEALRETEVVFDLVRLLTHDANEASDVSAVGTVVASFVLLYEYGSNRGRDPTRPRGSAP